MLQLGSHSVTIFDTSMNAMIPTMKNTPVDESLAIDPLAKDLRPRALRKELSHHDTRPRRTLSFYRYVKISDPVAFRTMLVRTWGAMGCHGRIYVAHEGINAQMNVPLDTWNDFETYVASVPELAGVPFKIAVEEGVAPSFYKLTIKVKEKIVADGLNDSTFDVTNTGAYLTAREINDYVDDPDALVVDMRNFYESEVGHFEGAILPAVETFKEELQVVPELLKVHKNKKIALYCTGGIRCEKASAWLKHNGFTDVRHLKGGVIDYKHQVEAEGLPNKFRGKNFVFDERLGERIGDEVIAHCHLCRTTACDVHHHCKNKICHVLFIGCEPCMKKKGGYCSAWCRVTDALPSRAKKVYARYYNQFARGTQFKKNCLR